MLQATYLFVSCQRQRSKTPLSMPCLVGKGRSDASPSRISEVCGDDLFKGIPDNVSIQVVAQFAGLGATVER